MGDISDLRTSYRQALADKRWKGPVYRIFASFSRHIFFVTLSFAYLIGGLGGVVYLIAAPVFLYLDRRGVFLPGEERLDDAGAMRHLLRTLRGPRRRRERLTETGGAYVSRKLWEYDPPTGSAPNVAGQPPLNRLHALIVAGLGAAGAAFLTSAWLEMNAAAQIAHQLFCLGVCLFIPWLWKAACASLCSCCRPRKRGDAIDGLHKATFRYRWQFLGWGDWLGTRIFAIFVVGAAVLAAAVRFAAMAGAEPFPEMPALLRLGSLLFVLMLFTFPLALGPMRWRYIGMALSLRRQIERRRPDLKDWKNQWGIWPPA